MLLSLHVRGVRACVLACVLACVRACVRACVCVCVCVCVQEFGAREVDNDHLLTSIGTVSTVAVAISRLFWGVIADVTGIKVRTPVTSLQLRQSSVKMGAG